MGIKYYNWDIPDDLELTYVSSTKEVQAPRFIQLIAPTASSIALVAPVKQMLTRAIMGMSKEEIVRQKDVDIYADQEPLVESDEETPGIDADTIMSLISMSSEVDYAKFLEACVFMIKDRSMALIDGDIPITKTFLNQFPLYCLEALIGEYLINFIAPSVTKE